jgi:hypothetical protein
MKNDYYWALMDSPVGKLQYISHHGILGQKWGVRRFQDKNGRLTAEGKKRKHVFEDHSESNMQDRDAYVTMAVTGALGTAATVGMAMTTGLISPQLAGYSALGLTIGTVGVTAGSINDAIANHKEKKFKNEREKNPIDKKTGFHKKTREMTADEDMERVNPAFKNWDRNTKNNCTLCTMAYELRRRGYDVQARKATKGYDANDLVRDWYKDSKPKITEGSLSDQDLFDAVLRGRAPTIKKENQDRMIQDTLSTVKKQKDGARGQLAVIWDQSMSGHSMAYAVENGEMTIYDTQANEKYVGDKECEKYLRKTSQIYVTRLDNCQINTKYIKEVAE